MCLALVLVLCAGEISAARAAGPAATESFSFGITRIQATTQSGNTTTTYRIGITHAPPDDRPFVRWYIALRPTSGGPSCSNGLLYGGVRVAATRFLWRNQGLSFVWYHGPVGSYPSDRAYGCNQHLVARAGYPGTVTVVLENDSETCSASFVGAGAKSPEKGALPFCELGGYLPLRVPRPLMRASSTANSGLTALVERLRDGNVSSGAVTLAAQQALRSQVAAFRRFFPPVWGCSFNRLFDAVIATRGELDAQIGSIGTDVRVGRSSLAADAGSLGRIGTILRACRPSAGRPIGTPDASLDAIDRLVATATRLSHTAPGTRAGLADALRVIDAGFEGDLRTDFPPVFGIPYSDLVDRIITLRSGVARAEHQAARDDPGAAASALGRATRSEHALRTSLLKQEARSAKAAQNA